jgi:hypothetical protein
VWQSSSAASTSYRRAFWFLQQRRAGDYRVDQREKRAKKHEPLVMTYSVWMVASSAPPMFHLIWSSISAFGVCGTLSGIPKSGCLFSYWEKALHDAFYPVEPVTPKTKFSKSLQSKPVVTGYAFVCSRFRRKWVLQIGHVVASVLVP